MTTSNAGYATNRQRRFTRSGALRPLRLLRLTRCRRFGPSPCPSHYGGRLATMPSADFCPITPGVAARRAARVAVGSGGTSSAFALALRPAPLATSAPLVARVGRNRRYSAVFRRMADATTSGGIRGYAIPPYGLTPTSEGNRGQTTDLEYVKQSTRGSY
jgi:hypothetical protein